MYNLVICVSFPMVYSGGVSTRRTRKGQEALEDLLGRHNTSIEDLLLEYKVPRRIHFRGHWISPGDRAYEAVESTIGPVIKAADPELAKKLKL